MSMFWFWAVVIACQVVVLLLLVVHFRAERREHKRRMEEVDSLLEKVERAKELHARIVDTTPYLP